MTDRYRVYTKVKKTLKHMLKLDHPGQVVTLAMMIVGIVLSRKAQLSEMSSEIPTATQEKSAEGSYVIARSWAFWAQIRLENALF